MPVFLFAVFVAGINSLQQIILIFVSIHFFLYPASNGFNSYYDKDEKSIGGLKNPPPVSRELLIVSLIFDAIALLLGLMVSLQFSVMLLVYGLISKAYSHPGIRLKKYPVIGWLTVSFFQGFFVFLTVITGLHLGWQLPFNYNYVIPALLSTLLLMASYPMTQVYQHKEDKIRGDLTLSLKLGILGTFHFTALMFFLASTGYLYFFIVRYDFVTAVLFLMFLSPVLIYFLWWYLQVRRDTSAADFQSTMNLNLISSLCLNGFFLWKILGDI